MASSHDSLVESRPRELWADNLRVLVVAGVIVAHTATCYLMSLVDWYYDERTTSQLWSTLLSFPVIAAAMFGLGPLFLLGGWFAPQSLARRGPGGFARSRLLRLGVPLLAFMLLIQPLADYVGHLGPDQVRTSFTAALRTTEFSVMWFVVALLVFSLVYAVLRWRRPAAQSRRPARPGLLVAAAALTIAVASLAVWQVWPWNSSVFFTARFGEWPRVPCCSPWVCTPAKRGGCATCRRCWPGGWAGRPWQAPSPPSPCSRCWRHGTRSQRW